MKKWTIAEIARINEENGFFYFSKNTLKFFKQTKSMFKVIHHGGMVWVYAKHGDCKKYSFAVFNPENGSCRPIMCLSLWSSIEQIKEYIKNF